MTARAHRNRVRRTVLASGARVLLLVVATAGGVAVSTWDRSEPQPAGTPTISPEPEPTPSEATVLPAGDSSLPFGVCGSVVGSTTVPATDPDAGYQVTATAEVPQGGSVALSARLVPPTSATQGFIRSSGPTSVITQDGVVVAIVPTYQDVADDVTWFTSADPLFPDDLTTYTTHAVPVVCDDGQGGGQPGTALPAGSYQVYALSELWTSTRDPDLDSLVRDGTPEEIAAATGTVQATAVGGPAPLTITAEQSDQPATVPTGSPQIPDVSNSGVIEPCAPFATQDGDGTDFTLTGPSRTVTTTVGAEVSVDLTTTFQGPGRFAGAIAQPVLLIWQDGELVGFQDDVVSTTLDGDHGTSTTSTVTFSSLTTCTDSGEGMSAPLPAGTYEVQPVTTIGPSLLTATDGTRVWAWKAGMNDEGYAFRISGEAFTLVVE